MDEQAGGPATPESALAATGRLRVNPSLDALTRFLADTGLDGVPYETVQVVGTNGKSSTAAMTAAVLAAYEGAIGTVGHFLSPHVCHYGERIALGGRSLSLAEFRGELESFFDRFGDSIERHGLTEFEILTAFAHELFARAGARAVVFEAGLGARFDATTALCRGVGALTSLALDHTELLGATLASIAYEKLAAFRGRPVVVGARVALPALPAELARGLGAVRFLEPSCRVREAVATGTGTRLRLGTPHGDLDLTLQLVGEAFAENAALAASVAHVALARRGVVDEERFARALAALETVRLPARFQVERVGGRTFVVDGSHNPEAVAAFARTARALVPPHEATVVFSFLADKDGPSMLASLRAAYFAGERGRVVVVPIEGAGRRAVPPDELRSLAAREGAAFAPDLAAAFEAANTEAVLVVGSLYLAGNALAALGVPPADGGAFRYFAAAR